jgi:hypothetical protein
MMPSLFGMHRTGAAVALVTVAVVLVATQGSAVDAFLGGVFGQAAPNSEVRDAQVLNNQPNKLPDEQERVLDMQRETSKSLKRDGEEAAVRRSRSMTRCAKGKPIFTMSHGKRHSVSKSKTRCVKGKPICKKSHGKKRCVSKSKTRCVKGKPICKKSHCNKRCVSKSKTRCVKGKPICKKSHCNKRCVSKRHPNKKHH